jgi:hypothetical protein
MCGTAGHGWRSNEPYTSDPARAAGSPRDAAISCRRGGCLAAGSTDGGLAVTGVLLPTDPAVQQHLLALFGPLLMVT